MKKKILMICYYYSPLLDVGTKRSIAFSKYLKKYGWEPYVLSVKNPDRSYCIVGDRRPPEGVKAYYTYSLLNPYRLLGKINGGISKILSLFGIELKRNYLYDIFCIPDIFFGWIPLTFFKGLSLIKKEKISFIYCSCPPFSSAIIGALLKIFTKGRLILDFRDPIPSDVHPWNFPPPLKIRRVLDRKIANLLFRICDLFIITTEELRKIYERKYPILKNKAFTIYNGVDPEEFPNLQRKNKFKKFTIVYAGNFYLSYGKPENFFKALSILKEKKKIDSKNFKFLYFGENKSSIEKIAKRYRLIDIVNAMPFIKFEKLISIIMKSHLHLIRIVTPMIATKLFEGIFLNIPLLTLTEEKEPSEIIKKYSPSSYILDENSVEEITNAILDAIDKYKKDEIKENRVKDFISEFSREKQTLKLISLLDLLFQTKCESKLAFQK